STSRTSASVHTQASTRPGTPPPVPRSTKSGGGWPTAAANAWAWSIWVWSGPGPRKPKVLARSSSGPTTGPTAGTGPWSRSAVVGQNHDTPLGLFAFRRRRHAGNVVGRVVHDLPIGRVHRLQRLPGS